MPFSLMGEFRLKLNSLQVASIRLINLCFYKGVNKMLSNIGIPGLIIILVLALILFGPNKLPELGRAVGQTLKEFKKSTRETFEEFEDELTEEQKRKPPHSKL